VVAVLGQVRDVLFDLGQHAAGAEHLEGRLRPVALRARCGPEAGEGAEADSAEARAAEADPAEADPDSHSDTPADACAAATATADRWRGWRLAAAALGPPGYRLLLGR
jgi:hypothetical protein